MTGMAKKPSPMFDPKALTLLALLYHLAALAKDFEACEENWNNYKTNPTGANLVRLAVAEGVFIRDLGLGE
jgi:hypothetical protein